MQRRRFLQLAAGALTAPALVACGARQGPIATRFEAERRWARLPQGNIAYVERGTGDAALFLHGFPLSSFQWRGALDRLSPVRRCIAPDFLALGATEVAEGQSVAPDAQVDMILALLDHLAVDRVDVVANDSGGAIAQLIATRHPGRVRTLLLTNCDVEPDSPPPALAPLIAQAHAGTFADGFVKLVNDRAFARSPAALGSVFTLPSNPTDEAIDHYLVPLISSPRRKALINAYCLGLEHNPLAGIEAALRASTIPTRVLWGTGDTIFSQASPDYLARTLGNSRGVRRIPGAKLFFAEEYPDLIADEARQLWGVTAGRETRESR
jgi:haloalkane dehalogenase